MFPWIKCARNCRDTMVWTGSRNRYCCGRHRRRASVLLSAGRKGTRFPVPNTDIIIHQVSGGAKGAARNVEGQDNYMIKLKTRLIKRIAQHTSKSEEQVRGNSDRDY